MILTFKFWKIDFRILGFKEVCTVRVIGCSLLLIEALSPLLDSSILEVMCLNYRFMVATIFDNSDKVATCLFYESNYLIVSSSLRCSCTLVLSAINIGAKTVL